MGARIMIRNLLVAYNGGRASEAAARAGTNIARKYDAHLKGLHAYTQSSIAKGLPGWLSVAMTQSVLELTGERAAAVRQSLLDAVGFSVEASRLHWIDTLGGPDQQVIRHSCLFDVLVIGQHEIMPEVNELRLRTGKIAELSGRPLLLAPNGNSKDTINDCAVIAWGGGQSASMAIMSTMEILRTKTEVFVVNIRDGHPVRDADSTSLRNQLQRHGICVQFEEVSVEEGSVSRTILNFCQKVGAGLLINGAYGHWRITKNFVGGVTRDLFRQVDVPVLVAQ